MARACWSAGAKIAEFPTRKSALSRFTHGLHGTFGPGEDWKKANPPSRVRIASVGRLSAIVRCSLDHYQTLGVVSGATTKEIKLAYRHLARKFHPDVSKSTDAEGRFREIKDAYEVLTDEGRRRDYDANLVRAAAALQALRRIAAQAHRRRTGEGSQPPVARRHVEARPPWPPYRGMAHGSSGREESGAGRFASRPPERQRQRATRQGAKWKLLRWRHASWPERVSWKASADVFGVWLCSVLWAVYGSQATCTVLALPLVLSWEAAPGFKVAGAIAWCCGGHVGVGMAVLLHVILRVFGNAQQGRVAVLALSLWVGRQASLYALRRTLFSA